MFVFFKAFALNYTKYFGILRNDKKEDVKCLLLQTNSCFYFGVNILYMCLSRTFMSHACLVIYFSTFKHLTNHGHMWAREHLRGCLFTRCGGISLFGVHWNLTHVFVSLTHLVVSYSSTVPTCWKQLQWIQRMQWTQWLSMQSGKHWSHVYTVCKAFEAWNLPHVGLTHGRHLKEK